MAEMTEDGIDWLTSAEPGTRRVELPHALGLRTFVSGDEGDRLRVQYFRTEAKNVLMAKVWFGPGTMGPPGHAHGGSIAAVLDEAMGGAAWLSGHPVLAAELITRFKRMVPLGARCLLRAEVVSAEGRKVRAVSELRSLQGRLYAEGEGLFVEIPADKLRELAVPLARLRRDSG